MFSKILRWLFAVIAFAIISAGGWLYVAPPPISRIAAGFTAKILCSNVFLGHRNPDEVLAQDVQSVGNPVLKLISYSVDEKAATVSAGLLGFFGRQTAVYRPGLGCTLAPDGDVAAVKAIDIPAASPVLDGNAPWPQGDTVSNAQSTKVANILDDSSLTGPGFRAAVVVKNGQIVAEHYAKGFSKETPHISYSVAKTINAALLGTLIKNGKLSPEDKGLFDSWKNDERSQIRIADLMSMSSGLDYNEETGDLNTRNQMLFLKSDMAGFIASFPLVHPIGQVFNYSTGTSVLLSRIWQNAIGDPAAALEWPRKVLFEPLAMHSSVLETDESGTFAGGSYVYASARDYARFGQFLLQDGVWNGNRILPEGFVSWMHEPSEASKRYGRGQVWVKGPDGGVADDENPDKGYDLPADTFWLLGFMGQSVTVIPSQALVIVRLGLTPDSVRYKPQAMVQAIMKSL
ncbi:serine hydrolase domain-containing protein [Phyllobacterium endophyticum]|uniref:serine hydrolase domain-containing protein n=1 Tax=Phyllobacterium endophyticum TaxID=1149773 RepID=UPI0011C9E914|nr:serine hydrolase [Phyllobacterium endophyticum]TXR49962.1 serine hydrolase [Phyllobacterium endophyticum]